VKGRKKDEFIQQKHTAVVEIYSAAQQMKLTDPNQRMYEQYSFLLRPLLLRNSSKRARHRCDASTEPWESKACG